MAEFVFKSMAKGQGREKEFYVESAAVSDEEYGNPIYPPARRCMSAHGIKFDSAKTARKMTVADYEYFDLIVCMDKSNLRWMNWIIGADKDNKVRLLMSYASTNRDVADPWYTVILKPVIMILFLDVKGCWKNCQNNIESRIF